MGHDRILVCDDDSDILEMIGLILADAGYEPFLAANHTDLLYYLENFRPDLILLDIRMPEWDGFSLAEMLHARGCTSPLMFMTAHDNTFCRVYSSALNAAGYLKKPFKPDELLGKIDEVLQAGAGLAQAAH